jgi:phage terminase small subunit
MALNDRQERFVNEYLIDLNATQAAIRCGYSEKTAYSQGQRLLKNVDIQKEVRKAQQKTINKLEITREDILQRAYMIPLLYVEMLELAQRDDLDEDEELRLIRLSNLIKGSDHNKALEILNKMQGFNEPEKSEVTVRQEPPLFSDEDLED